jgi:hypothetical protein
MNDELPSFLQECDEELAKSFLKFHESNPDIYDAFERFSREALKSGLKRCSHWLIVNRIRWYTDIETTGSKFKISNDYIALYARLLIHQFPEFDGFFTLKKMKAYRRPKDWKDIDV